MLPIYNDMDAYEDGPDDEEDGWTNRVYYRYDPNDSEEFEVDFYLTGGLYSDQGWVLNPPIDVLNPTAQEGNRVYAYGLSWEISREMAKKVTRDGLIIKANSISLEDDTDTSSGNVPLELTFYPQKGGSTYDKHCVY